MSDRDNNPYQPLTVPGGSRREWRVDVAELICSEQVVLPEICHSTLDTSDIEPRDLKLRCSSNASGITWFVVAGLLWYGSRQMQSGTGLSDLLRSVSGSLVIVASVVAVLVLAQIASHFLEAAVRVRVHESRQIAQKRRRIARLRRGVGGVTALVGAALVYVCVEFQTPPLTMALVLIPVGIGVMAERKFAPTGPKLAVRKEGGGMFAISGFGAEYLAAIATMRETKASLDNPRENEE